MKITIEKNEKNAALMRLMADKNLMKAMEAREAFAEFITSPILKVIQSEAIIGSLFTTDTYDYGTRSSIPLDPLFDIKQADFIKVWAQSRPGGLATSSNQSVDELMVMTYNLESAVSFKLDYLKAARVGVLASYMQRMAQEVLVKREVNAWSILAGSAAQSQYTRNGVLTNQVLRSQTQGTVIPQDVNRLVTLMSRVNSSWVGGTPQGASRAITTLIGSPEFMEQIRNMAFQALNTNNTNGALGGPDSMREEIYHAVGNPTIYGMELMNVYDMGTGFPYNIVYSQYAGTTQYPGYGQTGTAVFSPGSEQVVIGIDKRQPFLARLIETNPVDNSTLVVQADNQWSVRSSEIGFFCGIREGYVSLDGRNQVSLLF